MYLEFPASSICRGHIEAILKNIYKCSIFCPTILETVGSRVPYRNSMILIRFLLILSVATVLPIDVLRRTMTSVRILGYSKESLFRLTICYILIFLLSKPEFIRGLMQIWVSCEMWF